MQCLFFLRAHWPFIGLGAGVETRTHRKWLSRLRSLLVAGGNAGRLQGPSTTRIMAPLHVSVDFTCTHTALAFVFHSAEAPKPLTCHTPVTVDQNDSGQSAPLCVRINNVSVLRVFDIFFISISRKKVKYKKKWASQYDLLRGNVARSADDCRAESM